MKRELEAQIAEQCFGYVRKIVPPDGSGEHGGNEYLWPPDMPKDYDLPKKGPIGLTFLVPQWAERIENTWPLINKLTAQQVEVTIGIFPGRPLGVPPTYCIELRRWRDRRADGIPGDPHTHRSRETFVLENGDSLPVAICRAFLRGYTR